MSAKLHLSGLVSESITDGPGLRFVLFVQGCPRRCAGCHNPQTQPFEGGYRESIDCLLEKIHNNPLLQGVTISGGEPFCQSEELLPFAIGVRQTGLNLAVYTGYTFEELLRDEKALRLLRQIDILVDGPYLQSLRSLDLKFHGSSNQRILDIPASLQAEKACLAVGGGWL
ncbi:MAG: anaerobic ribonucleoside-triphosphate reductase activating protein [Christensenellales bacterium]|jgi:anaerobic ribonucleoside-triphosphate reductase activating protein